MTKVKQFLTDMLDGLSGPDGRHIIRLQEDLRNCRATLKAHSDERLQDVNGWGKLTRWLLANARDEILPGENSSEMAIRLLEKYRAAE